MCSICSRRNFLVGVYSSLTFPLTAAAQLTERYEACGGPDGGGGGPYNVTSTTSNQKLDRAIIFEARKITSIIPINPTFKFYDDGGQPNARAFSGRAPTLPTSQYPGTWGVVIIGLNLLNDEFELTNGGIALAGIIAHECAHIWQFSFPALEQALRGVTNQFLELHADYMAGFYFGRDGRRSEQDIDVFGNSLFRKGTYKYNDPDFHGTPEQRVAAMKLGYSKGRFQGDVGNVSYEGIEAVRKL